MANPHSSIQLTRTPDARLSAWAAIFTATVLVAVLGWLASGGESDSWYRSIAKAPGSPPGLLFAIVWPMLYILMAIGAGLAWNAGGSWKKADEAMGIYFVQLIANLGWTVLFFQLHAPVAALIDLLALWVLVLLMIAAFGRRSEAAAYLQGPYLLWLTFAAYLNAYVAIMN